MIMHEFSWAVKLFTSRALLKIYIAVMVLATGANLFTVAPLKGSDMLFNDGTQRYNSDTDSDREQSIYAFDSSMSQLSYPSQMVNLTNWKITLPVSNPKDLTKPLEIKQPQLNSYSMNPWFRSDGTGVVFRAPVNGVTTSGSSYPRSELREMTGNGLVQAAWSSTSGTHTMTINEAITVLPTTRKNIIAAQIHDASNAVIVIRLNYPTLYIDVQGKVYTLDSNYVLGKRFTIKYVVSGGKTAVYYNGSSNPVYTLSKSYTSAYFKAGAYVQSNCTTEKLTSLCNQNNFGEMVIYQLTVTHQ